MFFVRLVSFVIFIACINGQIYAMISSTSRAGKKYRRSLCSGSVIRSNHGKYILAAGGIIITGVAIKWLVDSRTKSIEQTHNNQEKEEAMKLCIEFFLLEKFDLQAFIKFTLEIGMNPNDFVMHNGMTALMFACKYGSLDEIKKLIELGNIKLNAQDFLGRSALSIAIYVRRDNVVSFLLDQEGIQTDSFAVQNILYLSKNPKLQKMFIEREMKILNRLKASLQESKD